MHNSTKISLIQLAFLIIACGFFVACLFLSTKIEVHAQEITEEYTQTDLEQDDRLNALELRLEELGYTINDTTQAIELLQAADATQEGQRLEISAKLDLLLIALNDVVNYDIELLNKIDSSEVLTSEYRVQVNDSLKALRDTALLQSENTVSGNTLISNLDSTLTEGNETSNNLLEQYGTYILIFVGIVIGCLIGAIFARFIKHD